MTTNSMFDPTALLDMSVDESMSTSTVPCPEGEYHADIKDIGIRPWASKDDPTKAGYALDVQWSIHDENVKTLLDRKEVIVKQSIMLDMTDNGKLDCGKGKNVGLGKLREAVNLNNPGQPFSMNQLPGRPAKVLVKHRLHEGNAYAEVKGVAVLS